MKKYLFLLLIASTGQLFSQGDTLRKTASSFYAGLNLSGTPRGTTYEGFAVGIQTLIKDTHLLSVELDHLINTDYTRMGRPGKENEVKTETNYEITYGRVLLKTKNNTKLILQSGLRLQYIKYQGKYLYDTGSGWLFCEPYYEKKTFWQPALPLKLTAFWSRKYTGNSLGIYANLGKYTDLGIQFTIHLLE